MLSGNDYFINQLIVGKVALDELIERYADAKRMLVESVATKLSDGTSIEILDTSVDELVLLKIQIEDSEADLLELIDDLSLVEDEPSEQTENGNESLSQSLTRPSLPRR